MKDESRNIEYKESWRDEYLKWICGFANAVGGELYIGVNDKKEVVGVKDSKKLMEDIPNKIVNKLGITCDVDLLEENGKDYIRIKVAPSNIPISYEGKYHKRSGSVKHELQGMALQQFIMEKMGHSWDDIAAEGATLDDIDRKAIDYFLARSIESGRTPGDARETSTEDVLRNLNLYTPEGKLKNAAILLFGKQVRKFFPSAYFKIGRFHTDESDLITQDLLEGNIMQMATQVVETLRSKYLISPIHYEGLQRIEELEIPEAALRELLYNSLAHREYMGPPIQMRVYDDRVELWNYGLLPEELTPEKLMGVHSSYPRNGNLAYAFFKAGFIEQWGRGFKKILEVTGKANFPMPTITETGGGVMAIIPRRSLSEIIANGDVSVTQNVVKDVVKDVAKPTVFEMSGRQEIICLMIKANPRVSAQEMSQKLSVTLRTVQRDLAILQEANIIRREGSPFTGIWVVLEKTQK